MAAAVETVTVLRTVEELIAVAASFEVVSTEEALVEIRFAIADSIAAFLGNLVETTIEASPGLLQ